MFGSPTGLGFLFIKKDMIECCTEMGYYGGGSVNLVLPGTDFKVLRKNIEDIFEAGTINYRSIISLRHGFNSISELGGLPVILEHVKSLNEEFKRVMVLKFGDNIVIHSHDLSCSITTLSLKRKNKEWIGYNEIINLAELHNPPIQLRGGCFCNQGACLDALEVGEEKVQKWYDSGHVCGDGLDIVDGERTGVLRISWGRESMYEDLEILVDFFVDHFLETTKPNRNTEERTPINKLTLKRIYVYPIKSCAPLSVSSWPLTENGTLKYDREFCLVDASGVAMRLNRYSLMGGIECRFEEEVMVVSFKGVEDLRLDLRLLEGEVDRISVCSNICSAYYINNESANSWFSKVVKVKCFLARRVDSVETFSNEADLLLISEGSVNKLNENRRLQGKDRVSEKSFRPNFVVSEGGKGNIEDGWKGVRINNNRFKVEGTCKRCNMVEIDPNRKGSKGGVLRSLGEYRRMGGRICFGVFVRMMGGGGGVKVGEEVEVEVGEEEEE